MELYTLSYWSKLLEGNTIISNPIFMGEKDFLGFAVFNNIEFIHSNDGHLLINNNSDQYLNAYYTFIINSPYNGNNLIVSHVEFDEEIQTYLIDLEWQSSLKTNASWIENQIVIFPEINQGNVIGSDISLINNQMIFSIADDYTKKFILQTSSNQTINYQLIAPEKGGYTNYSLGLKNAEIGELYWLSMAGGDISGSVSPAEINSLAFFSTATTSTVISGSKIIVSNKDNISSDTLVLEISNILISDNIIVNTLNIAENIYSKNADCSSLLITNSTNNVTIKYSNINIDNSVNYILKLPNSLPQQGQTLLTTTDNNSYWGNVTGYTAIGNSNKNAIINFSDDGDLIFANSSITITNYSLNFFNDVNLTTAHYISLISPSNLNQNITFCLPKDFVTNVAQFLCAEQNNGINNTYWGYAPTLKAGAVVKENSIAYWNQTHGRTLNASSILIDEGLVFPSNNSYQLKLIGSLSQEQDITFILPEIAAKIGEALVISKVLENNVMQLKFGDLVYAPTKTTLNSLAIWENDTGGQLQSTNIIYISENIESGSIYNCASVTTATLGLFANDSNYLAIKASDLQTTDLSYIWPSALPEKLDKQGILTLSRNNNLIWTSKLEADLPVFDNHLVFFAEDGDITAYPGIYSDGNTWYCNASFATSELSLIRNLEFLRTVTFKSSPNQTVSYDLVFPDTITSSTLSPANILQVALIKGVNTVDLSFKLKSDYHFVNTTTDPVKKDSVVYWKSEALQSADISIKTHTSKDGVKFPMLTMPNGAYHSQGYTVSLAPNPETKTDYEFAIPTYVPKPQYKNTTVGEQIIKIHTGYYPGYYQSFKTENTISGQWHQGLDVLYYTPGTFSWTKPAHFRYMQLYLIGGGGAGYGGNFQQPNLPQNPGNIYIGDGGGGGFLTSSNFFFRREEEHWGGSIGLGGIISLDLLPFNSATIIVGAGAVGKVNYGGTTINADEGEKSQFIPGSGSYKTIYASGGDGGRLYKLSYLWDKYENSSVREFTPLYAGPLQYYNRALSPSYGITPIQTLIGGRGGWSQYNPDTVFSSTGKTYFSEASPGTDAEDIQIMSYPPDFPAVIAKGGGGSAGTLDNGGDIEEDSLPGEGWTIEDYPAITGGGGGGSMGTALRNKVVGFPPINQIQFYKGYPGKPGGLFGGGGGAGAVGETIKGGQEKYYKNSYAAGGSGGGGCVLIKYW